METWGILCTLATLQAETTVKLCVGGKGMILKGWSTVGTSVS